VGTVLLATNVQKSLEQLVKLHAPHVTVGVTSVGAKLNIVFCFDTRKLKKEFSIDAPSNADDLRVMLGATLKGSALLKSASEDLESGIIVIWVNTTSGSCREERILEAGKAICALIEEYTHDQDPSNN
jgi:hypothetical protein